MNVTELRALLADATQSGAFFVDLHDRAAIADTGAALGFTVITIDLRDCRDKADLLDRIARAMRFPDWFGDNFDALADSLGDLSWLPATGYVLLLDHAQDLREHAPAAFETLLDILNEVATGWAEVDIAFWALLPLPAAVLQTL
jgi:RNAse (barnase) inhibitor barstar